jgi:3-oxoacyl-[acyl-carrier-protein] synthase-1
MRSESAARAYVTAFTLSSGLGVGNVATLDSLLSLRGGLLEHELVGGTTTYLGLVPGVEARSESRSMGKYECRSNRILAKAALQDGFPEAVARARERYGAERIGCFIGSITSGLMHLEDCYGQYAHSKDELGDDTRIDDTVNLFSAAEFCQQLLGISGPAAAISTACSSSAKVFATAARHIRAGFCDAAVVAGVDAAGGTIIYGFRSLGLLSTAPCRPWDRRRDGISIGEAGGFALLERDNVGDLGLGLLGFGESCDAYHMTSPHPQGLGARAAIGAALSCAGLEPDQIDYINLHGSGTPANDVSEDAAVHHMFGSGVPCSSTKGWTGHTQGAAGITEAIFSLLAIRHGFIPATLNSDEPDRQLRAQIVLENRKAEVRHVLSNSFGFGGNNCALIFGDVR